MFVKKTVHNAETNVCLPAGACQTTTEETVEIGGASETYLRCTDDCQGYYYNNNCVDYCPTSTYLQEDEKTCASTCASKKYRMTAADVEHQHAACIEADEECEYMYSTESTYDGDYVYCRPFCEKYSYHGECVSRCPENTFMNARNGDVCVDECASKAFWTDRDSYSNTRYCVLSTDDYFFTMPENVTINGEQVEYTHCIDRCPNYMYGQQCVSECPSDTFVSWDGQACNYVCESGVFKTAQKNGHDAY